MKEKHQCSGQVYNSGGSWGNRSRQCTRNGTVEEDGKWWCRIHAPSLEAQRREGAYQKWNADWERVRQAEEHAELCRKIGAAVLEHIRQVEIALDNGAASDVWDEERLDYLKSFVEEAKK